MLGNAIRKTFLRDNALRKVDIPTTISNGRQLDNAKNLSGLVYKLSKRVKKHKSVQWGCSPTQTNFLTGKDSKNISILLAWYRL